MKYPNGYFKPKNCRACGGLFKPETPARLYCSKQCRGKNAYYERVYGITEAELREMYEAQDHRCYLCRSPGFVISPNGTEKLAVDHCHETGAVRRLLCHNCNRALGLFHDDPELMRRAAKYIEMFQEGATTIPKGSRAKRPEAHSPSKRG